MKRKPSTTPCKEEGCEHMSIARRMCSKHWKQWRRKNPTVVMPQDSREQALKAMPATTADIVVRVEISHCWAKKILREMHLAGRCHIGAWREPLNVQGSQWAPIYHAGKGVDAPLDRAMTKERSYERSLERNRRNHNLRMAYKRRTKPVAFAALLAPLGVQP